jgi:DNA-binding beta-propeller fold protein YncE
LHTVPGQDVAVVLERLSSTVTVIRSKDDGSDDLVTHQTADGLNQLVLSPDGKYAVAFFDLAKSKGNLSSKQNFQEVTLVRLEPGKEKSVNLSVGFKPSGVQFSKSGSHAYVITEQGISVIQLASVTKPTIVPTIPVLKDPLVEAKPEEVLVTPDGKLALARVPGLSGMRVVDLETESITDIPLSGVPTDLDLTADGSLAVAIQREAEEIALIDIPADLADPSPSTLDILPTGGYQAGQATLSPDGKRAFLFTNATNQEVVLVADLTTRDLDVIQLKKGVRSVLSAPDGKTVMIVHNKIPGTPIAQEGFEAFVDKSYGYTLLKLDAGFDKLQLTSADPGPVAFAPDSLMAYLLLNDSALDIRTVEAIDLGSFLVQSVTVGSPPVAIGVMATTSMVYVAQNHPLGRVTFIDMDSHQTKTVTGFELNSHIIE